MYQDVGNLTLALGVFREVYKSINRILADSGLAKGELIDAQGLIQAYKRALERIDRLESLEGLSEETQWLLGNATLFLNVTDAMERLQLGLVNQTAHNMTQANKLIAQAHKTLKETAAEMNNKKIENYLKIMNNFLSRLSKQVMKLDNETLDGMLEDAADFITGLGGAEELVEEGKYSEAIVKLEEARTILEQVEQDMKGQRPGPKQ
jgi:predicted metal-dependent hydrolase